MQGQPNGQIDADGYQRDGKIPGNAGVVDGGYDFRHTCGGIAEARPNVKAPS